MIGVALEGVCDKRRNVTPTALAIGGELVRDGGHKLGPQLICQLLMLSGHKSLVTYSVDYLASLIVPHDLDAIRTAWAEKRLTIGPYTVELRTGRQLWIRRNGSAVLISDLRRWSPGGLGDLCQSLGMTDPGEIARWDVVNDPQAAQALAVRMSLVYGEIAAVLDDACVNTRLPRYWRDGPGRLGGALLDSMARPLDVSLYPKAIEPEIFSAYYGGRIDLLAAGEFDEITQLDIRSAYPWAMAQLPSLAGATWKRRTQYDPAAEWAVWWCEWDIADGVRIGPFPVRVDDGTAYPRTGRGYYWSPEVRAALDAYGADITVRGGVQLDLGPDERRPFADLAMYYAGRRGAKEAGLIPEAQLIKLSLNAAYGRLAQERLPDGTRGRWANIALAGMLTALVRARMLTAAQEYGKRVLAILTDSLTLEGDAVAHGAGAGLGEWSIKGGQDALLLPSGAYHVARGMAQLDRVAGLPLEQTRGLDWERVRNAWRSYGLIAERMGNMGWHLIEYPYYLGIGQAAALEGAARYRVWMRAKWDVIGSPQRLQVLELGEGSRVYFRPAPLPDDARPGRYVPQAALIGRRPHQQHLSPRWTIREIDQPTA